MSAAESARPPADYAVAVRQTLQSLGAVPDATLVSLTGMGIDAIHQIKQEVAEIFPASNLPAFLLQGLVQLSDRALTQERVAADLGVLFRGSKQIGLFGTFLAAPAAVLYGYQKLLALAGKDIASAFPDGPWQFYTEFGLREDAAHHCVETIGFARATVGLSPADAATCWVSTAIEALFAYDNLLANEWEERAVSRALDALLTAQAEAELGAKLPRKAEARARAIADHADSLRRRYQVERLAAVWAHQRPYAGPAGATLEGAVGFRQARFQAYLETALKGLPEMLRGELTQRVAALREQELAAYQRQLTILAALDAGPYQDHRTPLSIADAHVALVVGGRYYLFAACARDAHGHLLVFPLEGSGREGGIALPLQRDADGTLHDTHGRPIAIDRRGHVRIAGRRLGRLRPPPLAQLRQQVAAILDAAGSEMGDPVAATATDLLLAEAPREQQARLRTLLDEPTQQALALLRSAPIIVNWDLHEAAQPLTALRRTHRGIGDHALTVIRTERSMVFDLSHIFFDGGWGMALAEIMTNSAGALAARLDVLPPGNTMPPSPVSLNGSSTFLTAARAAIAGCPVEVAAETRAISLYPMNQLRQRLAKLQLTPTVNDLLILARCAHAATYQPGPSARQALVEIAQLDKGSSFVPQITRQLEEQRTVNPALLIPMDASAADPRLRLYPATFRNPRPELLARLDRCNAMVHQLQRQPDASLQQQFAEERRALYHDLQTFSATLQVLKQVTMRGESFTTAALRLLGHLPGMLQYLVDLIPQKIGILNEILKGREVFSNVGRVVPSSTLTRFASARDDGETKLLVWGIMADANGQLVVTLRDFRPHVASLVTAGRADLAQRLAQDYLDDYAACANALVRRLQRVLAHQ